MGKIKLLDNLTIQKIAAGEVIERPSSIIKELVENSLDANCKNIVIEIKDGGKTYIRVTDDGDGISEDDLQLAFKRHSTSKLREIDDLYRIFTLGFRGEALSSIAAVSKVEILTKTNDTSAGLHAFIEEGNITSLENVGTPKGTTMIVRDLFYNLPVRKKFLKSDLTESNKISDMVNKLALGNYKTTFKFIKDNRIVLKTNNNEDIKENIYTILGKDITKGLNSVEFKSDNIEIKGFISNNNLYRSNRNHQYLYINGRYIVNYALTSVIEQQYKSLIPINRYPVFILYINMNPNELDVNIHPTKQEVKFTGVTDIYGILGKMVKDTLFNSINIPKFDVIKETKQKEELIELFNNPDKEVEFPILTEHNNIIVKDYTEVDFTKKDLYLENEIAAKAINVISENNTISIDHDHEHEYNFIDNNFTESEDPDKENELYNLSPLCVVFNTYIIAENHKLNKVFFIDQHAAHERVMYERYKKEYENESINTQQLIVPEIIDLSISEFNDLLHNKEYFINLGFDIEEFGQNSIAIRGVPFIFGKPNIKNLFLDLLDNLDKDLKSSYDTKLEKLMKLACTSAIKGGYRIDKLEINSLLKDLSKCENPYSCPHGRPTVIEVTKKDLEKQFLRIM
ncbi:DNA mismatch repair endonuclease MutL [Tissierella sp. Yu-01]|uniref:DNA mismatch repair endonuclease MutL n=1 Tax=Tissierella sp. Yu-01 TaxID=3035694 RepID=UPI00240D1FD5|nr:DNA mismatch repair endonuclease MutL [Tissierella sp. Yu-01]WFA09730.1 DNA mismatch repair endonuclease MutL [Tissierella sp. Yu-01]